MMIVVTGGAGYVGTVLVPELLRAGHAVCVLDCLRYGGQPLLPMFQYPRFSFVLGDVRDPATAAECLAGADAVVHLAAIVGYPACIRYPDLARAKNVVEALSDDQALVYASTGSNYGRITGVCDENSPLNPVSLYAVTKTEGEQIALTAPRGTALRFGTAFGVSPRMRLDLLINDFVHRAMVDQQLIVYEEHFRRTLIHVRDMARGILFALEHIDRMRGQAYNVGNESLNLTKRQIAEHIRRHLTFYLHFADVGHDADARDYEVSYKKVHQLGFETAVTLDEGIQELIRAMPVLNMTSPYTNL